MLDTSKIQYKNMSLFTRTHRSNIEFFLLLQELWFKCLIESEKH